jgi:hypothetical protein
MREALKILGKSDPLEVFKTLKLHENCRLGLYIEHPHDPSTGLSGTWLQHLIDPEGSEKQHIMLLKIRVFLYQSCTFWEKAIWSACHYHT